MRDLDPWKLRLGGTKLIEASAGTGKTFTLTTLYVRLLVEEDLLPSQILVVTYTQAATAELRERVRERIREVIAAGETAEDEDVDPDLRALALAARERREKRGGEDALRRALQEFDEAAIFTIHGFCQRTLQENAFESGVAFGAELVEKSEMLNRTLAHDLWARLLAGERDDFVEWLLRGTGKPWKFNPEELRRSVLDQLGADEEMPVLPGSVDESTDFEALGDAVAESWLSFARAWVERREVVKSLLLGKHDLNKRSYEPARIESSWFPQLEAWANSLTCLEDATSMKGVGLPGWFRNLTPAGLEKGLNKNGEPVADAFFSTCGALRNCVEALDSARRRRLLALRRRFVDEARESASRRRDERHLLFFDDLLSELRSALRPPQGDRLADLLRERYRFALIDEFQDTDPVQYEIFRRVWHVADRANSDREPGGLVLVGDPKQAVYSFRGADVFTYLAARTDAKEQAFHLGVNWRSARGLIAAVNALFGRPQKTFGLDAIEFNPVAARPDAEHEIAVPGRSVAGLRVLLVDRSAANAHLGVAEDAALPVRFGRTDLMRAVANDIAGILESGVMIGDRPLNPSDIAVICRRKLELAAVRRALEALGVACVDRGDADVFESREAWELASVMRAMLRSGDPSLLRGALSTGAHGFDAPEIAELGDDDPGLAVIGERFAEYARVWSQSGFGRAFSAWRRGEGVTQRLLSFDDGERRLTNWMHLAELLQRIENDRSVSRMGLVSWLEQAIESPDARIEVGSDASLLRLERDDHAISLVTLHRSKGLEYEIVYLPSLWEKASSGEISEASAKDESKGRTPVRFFDKESQSRTLDLGGDDYAEHVEVGKEEALSEQLRLLYVGVTRAKRQCVVAWGAIGPEYAKTPLAWLLHAPQWQAEGRDRSTSAAEIKKWSDRDWRTAWESLAKDAGEGAVAIEAVDFEWRERWQSPTSEPASLDFTPAQRHLGPAIVTTSFSALVREATRTGEALSGSMVTGRDRDLNLPLDLLAAAAAAPPAESPPDLAASMQDFPRGAEAGTLLHDILEKVDFSAVDEDEVRRMATSALDDLGLALEHVDRILHVVDAVANVPLLDASAGTSTAICLSDVKQGQQRPEIEFTLRATVQSDGQSFSPSALASLLATEPPDTAMHLYADRLSRMSWRALNGFLRGFIDSVFFDGERYYLIDYKSNHLGALQADYAPARLTQPMIEHDYVLQYLIYAIALDRHLAQRLEGYDYEDHFGGVYYLFVRGLAPTHAPGCGIFFDRPSRSLIHGASELIGGSNRSREAS